jgi:hypothetical protein
VAAALGQRGRREEAAPGRLERGAETAATPEGRRSRRTRGREREIGFERERDPGEKERDFSL